MMRCKVCHDWIFNLRDLTQQETVNVHLLVCMIQSFGISFEVNFPAARQWRVEWGIRENALRISRIDYGNNLITGNGVLYMAWLSDGASKLLYTSDMLDAAYKDLINKQGIIHQAQYNLRGF